VSTHTFVTGKDGSRGRLARVAKVWVINTMEVPPVGSSWGPKIELWARWAVRFRVNMQDV